jgi:hypothetical protein
VRSDVEARLGVELVAIRIVLRSHTSNERTNEQANPISAEIRTNRPHGEGRRTRTSFMSTTVSRLLTGLTSISFFLSSIFCNKFATQKKLINSWKNKKRSTSTFRRRRGETISLD